MKNILQNPEEVFVKTVHVSLQSMRFPDSQCSSIDQENSFANVGKIKKCIVYSGHKEDKLPEAPLDVALSVFVLIVKEMPPFIDCFRCNYDPIVSCPFVFENKKSIFVLQKDPETSLLNLKIVEACNRERMTCRKIRVCPN